MDNEDNVVFLETNCCLDIPCERVLSSAIKADLAEVVVMGREQDGTLYFASSLGKICEAAWLTQSALTRIYNMDDQL